MNNRRPTGVLEVRVRNTQYLPRSILNRFSILCAILRQLYLILYFAVFSDELRRTRPTWFIVDQLSAGVPLLQYLRPDVPLLFYCHFPDKLLADVGDGGAGMIKVVREGEVGDWNKKETEKEKETEKQRGMEKAKEVQAILPIWMRLRRRLWMWVKQVYRYPFDALESWSTGCADVVVVNSMFTGRVFERAFPRLKKAGVVPAVVYPCVADETNKDEEGMDDEQLWPGIRVLLSINRFEEKKNVGLAIRAFARLSESERKKVRLVIAGMANFLYLPNPNPVRLPNGALPLIIHPK